MRVNENGSNPLQGAGVHGAGGAHQVRGTDPAARRGSHSANPDGDSVELSALGQALRAEDSESAERAQRVERLRADFRTGQYEADPQQLGRTIVADALNGGL